jgi:AAA15 family ATPase/GTPase
MILEFGAKNFFSFKEGFRVSFRQKNKISEIITLNGANASGKTNVIKVLSFLKAFTLDSFGGLKPEDEIGVYSYFKNNDVTSLYIEFLDNDIEYRYELDLTNKKIISETISKKVKRWTPVIKRINNTIKASNEFKSLSKIKYRNNASLISTSKQYEIDELNMIYNFFSNIFSNVYLFGRMSNEKYFLDYKEITKLYYEDKDLFKGIVSFLKDVDTGIEDINIIEDINKETNKKEYLPIFIHDTSEEKNYLTFMEQSSGTQSLYLQLGFYVMAIIDGALLSLDEFDINLHPDIVPKLLGLFTNQTVNKNNAQLIVTTHNDTIMDIIGKYQTILVNKKHSESFLYRLDEIPGDILRPDRKVSPVYQANKIGGKPKIK